MAVKAKTHSGAKKRFKKLKSGKIKHAKSYHRHLLTKKTSKRKRDLRQTGYIASCDIRHIAPLLP
jgi:large subunit ribosomal protein L35